MPLTEIGRLDKVWRWRLCHFPRVYVVDKQRVNKSFTTTTILGVIFGLICYFRNEGDFKLSRNMADWTSDANEALVLSLGRHSHPCLVERHSVPRLSSSFKDGRGCTHQG